jgi:uncharacterized protein (TIGR03435 family)
MNVTVRMLIRTAYEVQNSQIVGAPNWITHARFDIEAKSDNAVDDELRKLSPAQGRLVKQRMLQALLADRFNLTLRRETRSLPIYALVVAKHGPKIQESRDSASGPSGFPRGANAGIRLSPAGGEQQISFHDAPLSFLGQILSEQVGRTVLDETGLKGNYSFTLKWVPEVGHGLMFGGPGPGGGPEAGGGQAVGGGAAQPSPAGMPSASGSSNASDSSGPSIFTAIQQQLGLRLKPEKGRVEVLVVEHVDQPSPN